MKRGFNKQDFYDLLIPNGDCLEWTKCISHYGYGQTGIRDNKDEYKRVYTHRLALTLEGYDVEDWYVLHSCDNRKCCNPKHLRLGTHKDNMQDALDRNRTTKGIRNASSKLTDIEVLDIRRRHRNGEMQKDIAIDYNITQCTISSVVNRKTWSHI
jgi:hypothetical protein|tara:strand:+ start:122 stop:586 length:465 start_codon:yes stop_codon:yes gene_type:complete